MTMIFALAGRVGMQVEAARCSNESEALRLASLWESGTKDQLAAMQTLPSEQRKKIVSIALDYVSRLSALTPTDRRTGPLWLCHILPSYAANIASLPDTVTEGGLDGTTIYSFISNPQIPPELASEADFAVRRDRIYSQVRATYE